MIYTKILFFPFKLKQIFDDNEDVDTKVLYSQSQINLIPQWFCNMKCHRYKPTSIQSCLKLEETHVSVISVDVCNALKMGSVMISVTLGVKQI